MLPIRSFAIVVVVCQMLLACNSYNDVINKEPIFNNFKPESKEYRNKLSEIIRQNPDNLTYVFEQYRNINGADYLEVKVNGDTISATAHVLVKEKRNGVNGIIEKKGMSYAGAELYGLKLKAIETPSGAEFIYKDLDFIID